jgi:PHO85 cyclin-5
MTHAELLSAFGPTHRINGESHPYTPSIASIASSSSTSVFSTGDGPSSHGSAASSVRSAHLSWDGDAQKQHLLAVRCRPPMAASTTSLSLCATEARTCQPFGPASNAVPPELRLHPRRTQHAAPVDVNVGGARRQPPPLVRQCDRKDNFVENLVGKRR